MKDGFYLSTYLHIDPLAYCYNCSARHNHNLSLWKKTGAVVDLVHYWELERVTGMKHHARSFYSVEHAVGVIDSLLAGYGLSLEDMEEIWGTPGLDRGGPYYFPEDSGDYAYHNTAHLYSAMLSDTDIFNENKVIALSLDGGPDNVVERLTRSKKHFVGCYAEYGEVKEYFPVYSPGPLWNAAKNELGMEEGSLMALASASESVLFREDSSILLCDDMQSTHRGTEYVRDLVREVFALGDGDVGVGFSGYDPRFSERENKISMVMKRIQRMSLEIMRGNIRGALESLDLKAQDCCLSIAGGYALNCPTNSSMMREFGFQRFYTVPCVNDSGISMGIALYAFYKRIGGLQFRIRDAFQGDDDTREIRRVIAENGFERYVEAVSEWDADRAVQDVMRDAVVWFEGRGEIGPRALGHRSILADPRSEGAKDRINQIKKRQWWRPVAPIVKEEQVQAYFVRAYSSPYMLHTFLLKDSVKELLPAVAHLDASARIQTAGPSIGKLYELLDAFDRQTSVAVLCNTSLNDIGEPIINRMEEAIHFALSKKIPVLYIDGRRVQLHRFEEYSSMGPWERALNFDRYRAADDIRRDKQSLNPFNLPFIYLQMYIFDTDLHSLRLDRKEDVAMLRKIVDRLLKSDSVRSWVESGQTYL